MKYIVSILLLSFSILIVLSCSADSPTEDESKEIYWYKSDSPILIEGCYIVPENTTLTIEAGTEIRFKSKSKKDFDYTEIKTGMLVIQGMIIAEGTEQDSIIFTKDDSVENWGAIVFEESADPNSILKYCKIQYCSEVEDYQYTILGAITFLAFSKANVENCNITDSYYGIQCNGYAEPNIIGCAISNCVNGIYSYLCRSNIRNCTIKNNGANGIYGYMSYLSLKNSIISNNGRDGIAIENGSYPDIINNVIEYNGYAGIDCYEECAPNIENNLIMNNLETGMLFNYYCLPNIVNNLIAGSIKGIHLANWSDANIINNTVTGNDFAFRLYGDCTPQIINTIVWDNIEVIDPLEDHYYYYNSNPILFSSLIQGDSLHYSITDQGDNIIGIDPLFIDDSLDFNLQSSSPCIESGFNDIVELPEFDLLGNPRIVGGLIDIGAYEYQGSR